MLVLYVVVTNKELIMEKSWSPIPKSPLEGVKNLETLSPARVQAFLDRMKDTVIPRIIKNEKRQAELVAEMRKRPLF